MPLRRNGLWSLDLFVLLSAWARCVNAAGCRLDDGLCICEDNGGTIWDVTALGVGDKVVKGPADGCTICVGEWNYHWDICGNVDVPDALGCSSTALASAYRVDEYTTPTSRSCELLGPDVEGSGTLGVAALTGRQQGVQLTYTYLQRALRLNLICDSASMPNPDPVEMGGSVIDMQWRTAAVCRCVTPRALWRVYIEG